MPRPKDPAPKIWCFYSKPLLQQPKAEVKPRTPLPNGKGRGNPKKRLTKVTAPIHRPSSQLGGAMQKIRTTPTRFRRRQLRNPALADDTPALAEALAEQLP
ncbi:unnamed protein product [Prunus armeniaca]